MDAIGIEPKDNRGAGEQMRVLVRWYAEDPAAGGYPLGEDEIEIRWEAVALSGWKIPEGRR